MTVKHKCSAKTPDMYGVPNAMPCRRSGTVQRNGKWYCWQHDPEYAAKKTAEHRAGWQAEMDREAAKYRRIARNARLGALVTLDLASLLDDLAAGCDHSAWLAAERGWAMAARIREALAQEANDES